MDNEMFPIKFCGRIKYPKDQLNLELTLCGGQSFRWKCEKSNNVNKFIGVMNKYLWSLYQTEDHLEYEVFGTEKTIADAELYESLLNKYFRLETNLIDLYKKWSLSHAHFKNTAGKFQGIRMLDQDPLENILSFLCSQNNHINRISKMVENMCSKYGEKICKINEVEYFMFPTLQDLNLPTLEEELRELKFGYRAKFINRTIKEMLEKGGENWFQELKDLSYLEAKRKLLCLPGIGPKVADCICLMSLGHLESVPVDTHIYQIARQYYLPDLRKTKNLSSQMYTEVSDAFRKTYGDYAGWAQTVFTLVFEDDGWSI